MKSYDSKPNPGRLLWVLGILLAVVVVALVILWWMGKKETPKPVELPPVAESQPPPAACDYRGKYYYAGQPVAHEPLVVLTNIGFVTGFSEQRKVPVWTCYRLFHVDTMVAPPRPDKFAPDPRTQARIVTADYTGSGYDRGHCAPNYGIAICYGREAQAQTFLLSNILPERPKLNRQIWEGMEETEIRNYAQRLEEVWIVTGGVFDAKPVVLKHGVQVPSACFKIMVDEEQGKPRMLAFIIPQDVAGNESPIKFLTSVDEVEKETGFDLFSDLPDDVEDRLEAETAKQVW